MLAALGALSSVEKGTQKILKQQKAKGVSTMWFNPHFEIFLFQLCSCLLEFMFRFMLILF